MAPIDDLAPDQRAVLQLLLKQGKSYDELSALLRIEPDAVRDRAVGALEALGPRDGAPLPEERRAEIADYLLGQQTASQRQATREFLEGSASGRGWARVAAGELRPLAGDALPEIPAEGAELDEAFDALGARQARQQQVRRSSRRGGIILLVALGVVIAAVVLLIVNSGSDSGGGSTGGNGGTLATSPPSTTSTTSSAKIVAQINLLAQPGAPKSRLGVARVVEQSGQRVLAFEAQGLPASTSRLAYGVWVKKDSGAASFLGYPQATVGKNGKLAFVSALSTDLTQYKTLLVTREPTSNKGLPKQPGEVVLSGPIRVASGG
jgi:Anti-sigma-K factor rskA, C-terminal